MENKTPAAEGLSLSTDIFGGRPDFVTRLVTQGPIFAQENQLNC